MTDVCAALTDALRPFGLVRRGGFHTGPDDDIDAATVVLIGAAGGSLWPAFSLWLSDPQNAGLDNPLDAWTVSVIDPLAADIGAEPVYPFRPPWQPFQRWAARAEPVHFSPLGLLIHPDYGLWHAYRAALLFSERIALPERVAATSPCDTCAEKPCLTACPVGAFTGDSYDVAVCADHLSAQAGRDCLDIGCRARDACPVGTDHHYGDAQRRFHMAAFARARGVEV